MLAENENGEQNMDSVVCRYMRWFMDRGIF